MKNSSNQFNRPAIWAALFTVAAALLCSVATTFAATTVLLDENGTTPGFWDGTTPFNCDVTSSVTWTTDTNGVVAPTIGSVADNFQIGWQPSDFNGAMITFSTLAATLAGTNFSVIASNAQVTWASSGNAHFNTSPTTVSVAAGSTLTWTSTANNNGFNFNGKSVNFTGAGIMNFQDAFCANAGAGVMTMNMTGGTLQLAQTKTSNWGATTGGSFILTNGMLQFTSATALADTFQDFGAAGVVDTFKINGGAMDNTSGSAGVLALGAGTYSLGGNFTFIGSSSLDLGSEAMTNTANHTITVLANTLSIGGGISGPGNGLTLAGPGTLSLYGVSTYSGSTVVQSGTLALTGAGSLTNSTQIFVNNATFDVSGLSGNYAGSAPVMLSGSTFNLSNHLATGISTLGITNSTLDITLGLNAQPSLVATNLYVGGTTNLINIQAIPLVAGYPTTYNLISVGTVNGTLNFGLGTVPPGWAFIGYVTNVAASGLVNLVLTGGPAPVHLLTWSGLVSGVPNGTWDVANTPTWLTNGSPAVFNQLDLVTFNDSAAGATTVNIAGGVMPGSLLMSNNALNYVFTGGGLSDGSGGLILNKKGTGTLLLQESGDNFTGGINVGSGTVIIDNDSSGINGGAAIAAGAILQLGTNDTAGVLPTGTVTDNGTFIFNRTDEFTENSVFVGSGLVEDLDTNLIALAGASSGNWSTLIENGTLQADNNGSLGSLPGGAVTITNGGTFDVGGNTTANNANFGAKQFYVSGAGVGGNGAIVNSYPVTQEDAFENITLTTNATFGGANRWDMRNGTPLLNLAGYTLTKTNANQISLVSPHVTSGNIVIQQGTLSFEATPSFDASTGTITVNNGGFVGDYEDTRGSFTRGIVLNGGGVMNLSAVGTAAFLDTTILLATNSTLATASGNTEYFDGVISDGGAGFGFTQTGLGTNFLAATNTFTGQAIVSSGTLGLTNHGSMFSSALILVTNTGAFDVSRLAGPFSGTNSLVLGDDSFGSGALFLGNTLITNFSYLSLSNAVVNLAIVNPGVAPITVTNLNVGDGGASSYFNITALPIPLPTQFPLIKYAVMSGSYNLSIGNLPSGYGGNLVNNTANHSIDLLITAQPAGLWNGGDSAANNNWSDPLNWSGESLTGNDPLVFTGTAGLNNTNDTSGETAEGITFIPGAGAYRLNGNPVALLGGITNNSSNLQIINLGLSFGGGGSGTNLSLNGGTAGLIIGGGLTNTFGAPAYMVTTLNGTGILTNLLGSTMSPGGTNSLAMISSTANWTLVDNAAAIPVTVPWAVNIQAGTFNFGTTASAPNFNSTTVNGAPQDNQVGDISGQVATFNLVNGTYTSAGRFDTALVNSSTGIVSQVGGTFNMGSQFQGANGGTSNALSIVIVSGGIMNIGGATPSPFYVASRDTGSLTVSNTGVVNCSYVDVSRNANGNTRGSQGTVNLNGGTLAAARVGTAIANSQPGPASQAFNPTATFNFNGGTLLATTNAGNFYQGSTASPAIPITSIVKTGGAVINDGGFAISVLEPLQHDSTLGATSDGGLTKLGAGNLTIGSACTYTGGTHVNAGTLTVNGSLGASAVTVASAATLSGTGSLGGSVTVNAGGTLAPGTAGGLGNLTIAGNVSLLGTNVMGLNPATLTNNVVSAANITYGGALSLTTLAGTLTGTNTFKLFNATTYSGAFAAIVPATPGAGLLWNTNTLSTGVLSITSTAKPVPVFTSVSVSGATLHISATNGATGGQYELLGTTNLTLPLNQWTPVLTNNFDGSGNLNLSTNIINPAQPQQFYLIVQ